MGPVQEQRDSGDPIPAHPGEQNNKQTQVKTLLYYNCVGGW